MKGDNGMTVEREGTETPPVFAQDALTPLSRTDTTRETARTSVTYSCGGCDNRWPGVSRAHCSACHETFGGAAFFDRHRRERNGEGYCLHPSQIEKPVMFLANGIWSSVENPVKRVAPRRSA